MQALDSLRFDLNCHKPDAFLPGTLDLTDFPSSEYIFSHSISVSQTIDNQTLKTGSLTLLKASTAILPTVPKPMTADPIRRIAPSTSC